VGRASYDPGARRWSITAGRLQSGRGETLETVTGTGEDKLAAMTCLTIAKDDRRRGELLEEIDRLRRDS
jgi:hypothetical protein